MDSVDLEHGGVSTDPLTPHGGTMTLTIETPPETMPVEPTTPMRLSEAIRLGCLVAPEQAFGSYVLGSGARCALGAAGLALGFDMGRDDDGGLGSHFPLEDEVPCPAACKDDETDTASTVVHLNDTHRWTRERIASWLETLGL